MASYKKIQTVEDTLACFVGLREYLRVIRIKVTNGIGYKELRQSTLKDIDEMETELMKAQKVIRKLR